MSFKQLLKKGTLGDLRERVSPDRDSSAGGPVQTSEPSSAPARCTRVLYITGDARESRIVSGAFSHTHPHLEFDFSADVSAARAQVTGAIRHEAIVVGWSLSAEDAFALIGYAREHGCELPIIAAAEQSLDLYRQAGADECVRKGGSFLSRLPIAIEDAVKKRPARPQARTFSPGVASLRVAFAGNLQQLTAALEGQLPPLECVDLQETLKDADLQASAPPFDIVLIEHGDKSSVAIADVRARNLEVALVLLVDPADERGAYETFGASIDDYVAKTPDWPTRLQLRLTTARTRYQQTRELAALRVKEARLRSLVEKLPACILRVSADGLVLATNDRAVSLLGASNANQLLRKPFDVMVSDDEREAWTDFVVRVCAGDTRSTEVSITTLSGVSRAIEVTAVPSPSEFGRSPSALMVLRDASDRKRLEAAVEQTTEQVDETTVPEADFDVELPEAAPVADFAPEPEAPVAVAVKSHRPLRDLEVDLHRISGTARATFQELGTLLRDAESQHDAALSRQADEYARLKAIELEHFRFYESFIQAASHGVFRATPEGRLLDVNPSLATVLGYDRPSDVLAASDSIDMFMDASTWTDTVARWRGGASEPLDTRWLSRDRQVLTLRLYGRAIESPRGDGECLEVVAENISAQRSLEGRLRRARRWEDVARITSGIAADLTHVVETVTGSNDLETMQREAAKALALSRQLVAFGRREARDLAPLDLNAVVSRMEDVLRRLLDEHIDLTLRLGQLSSVLAAQPPIEEALVNLTVAAADVLPAGGRVCIETGCVVVDGATASAHDGIDQGEYGVIALIATGWGIDAGTRDRLLAGHPPAEHVSRGYSSAVRALGQSGGGLRLDSAGGDSMTFRVYLPLVHRGDS
jgi:PAS domain S-box-containing protein